MSKATFDRLDTLHKDHSYQRAIEDLFRLSAYEDTDSQSCWRRPWFAGTAITSLLAVIGSVILIFAR